MNLQEDSLKSRVALRIGNGFKAYLGPSLPLPELEKKLDFSPSLVDIKRPIRKIVGTPTKSKLAIKPKLVVSMNSKGTRKAYQSKKL